MYLLLQFQAASNSGISISIAGREALFLVHFLWTPDSDEGKHQTRRDVLCFYCLVSAWVSYGFRFLKVVNIIAAFAVYTHTGDSWSFHSFFSLFFPATNKWISSLVRLLLILMICRRRRRRDLQQEFDHELSVALENYRIRWLNSHMTFDVMDELGIRPPTLTIEDRRDVISNTLLIKVRRGFPPFFFFKFFFLFLDPFSNLSSSSIFLTHPKIRMCLLYIFAPDAESSIIK